ncbi:PEP-CTERM sorting domain-containing protein [Bythopirellula goksoeyrii]|uniref:Ice-binding protein C-terminal domain-containing protein n=1 Tax=Bythopirellula goksoeyrii TaxID=1400387 RepID=A0A5B9QFF5_9BACT|nr:PEP-CTERM sorting domain-containing protein [Bythopirellula goksoeyrii]QEG37624.1 hypothetical protein Pr1d_49700 [Bythopirellula goksoeyrii]
MRVGMYLLAGFLLVNCQTAFSQSLVVGGQTNVAIDFDTLSSAAGLDLSSVSPEVISPGSIPDSVAFPINARDGSLPTTFEYDATTFPAGGSFMGTIEHSGSVLFNTDTIEIGDFTIGFDAGRTGTLGGLASGFFVANNVSGVVPAPVALFDIEVTGANPQVTSLTVDGNLLVSPELGTFLVDNALASTNLQGTPVGVARVEAVAVPEPTAALLLGVGVLGGFAIRRTR